jgi:GTP-binding protein YchF
MKAGIVGLPNVGKSTLFNALSNAGAAANNYPFCTIDPNIGVVPIPDPRLAELNRHIDTKQVIPAVLQLVDIAGLVRGASQGEGLGNQFLSHIREVDAILHVVRCFANEDVTHVDGEVDPVRDVETIETELMLADLQVVENALTKQRKNLRSGDKETAQRVALLEQCQTLLQQGRPVRHLELDSAEQRSLLKGFGLITAKQILYIANLDEGDTNADNPHVQRLQQYVDEHDGAVVAVCARIEAELAELDPSDQREMLDSMGMDEPALAKVARAAYRLLGLQSFFTAGPKEIKAWTIPIGATAPQAAGVIHSDFERGFIRVETYTVSDLTTHHTEAAIKAAGKMRLEGKTYVMQDGDVCHFLFNV